KFFGYFFCKDAIRVTLGLNVNSVRGIKHFFIIFAVGGTAHKLAGCLDTSSDQRGWAHGQITVQRSNLNYRSLASRQADVIDLRFDELESPLIKLGVNGVNAGFRF